MRCDRQIGLRVVIVEELQGTIREHDPECGVGSILLDEANLDVGTAPLEQVAR
jgi:hypothetical protein